MGQEQVEEYLEAIYDMEARDGSAKTTVISHRLKVAPASVTEALKSLSERGLVKYEPYRGATLTDEGRSIAATVKRRHRLLEVFLNDILHISQEKVHEEACRMEHTLSDETEDALCRMLEAPARCPHGSPIAPCNRAVETCSMCTATVESTTPASSRHRDIVPIIDMNPRQEGPIAFIRGDQTVVHHLSDLGLRIGTRVSVTGEPTPEGTVGLLRGKKILVIDRILAEKIYVDSLKNQRSGSMDSES